jgi:transposase
MEQQEVYVGIDVAKEHLDVALRPSDEFFSERNDQRSVSQLAKRLTALGCSRIVVEATGGYETLVVSELAAEGLPVVLVNPRWVRSFARGTGQLAKTDRLDARVLAHYAEHAELKVRSLPDEQTRELKALCTRRCELLEMVTAEHNRLERAPKRLRREIKQHIDYLEQRIKALDGDIDRAVRSSELWRHMDELMDSVPGVGRVLRATLLARLPELGRLSRLEAAKLVGVAPLNDDSGKHRGQRQIGGGRAQLRRVLYMSTMGAIRHNPWLRAHYNRLRAAGKAHKVALVATMRKLLLILNAVIRTDTPWRPPCPVAPS